MLSARMIDEEVEAAVRATAQVFADLNFHVDEISLKTLEDLSVWRSGVNVTAVRVTYITNAI